jgi:hypothetical protein
MTLTEKLRLRFPEQGICQMNLPGIAIIRECTRVASEQQEWARSAHCVDGVRFFTVVSPRQFSQRVDRRR